jgi:hypothetical protein
MQSGFSMSDGVRHSRTWANHERQRAIPGRPRRCVLSHPYKVDVCRQDFVVWGDVQQLTQTGGSLCCRALPTRPKQIMRLQHELPKDNLLRRAEGTSVTFRESRDGVAK